MAAEMRARDKAMKDWFGKTSHFNYTHLNRRSTFSLPGGYDLSGLKRPAALLKKLEIRIRFALYILSLLNNLPRQKSKLRVSNLNARPLPAQRPPPAEQDKKRPFTPSAGTRTSGFSFSFLFILMFAFSLSAASVSEGGYSAAMAPQHVQLQGDLIMNRTRLMDAAVYGNINTAELAKKVLNKEPLNPLEYQAVIAMVSISPSVAELDYLSKSPIDTINASLAEMKDIDKTRVYKNLIKYEKNKKDGDSKRVIEYYRQLIRLEPDKFEHYRNLYRFVRLPPQHYDDISLTELASYTRRASELAPDIDTKIAYLFETADVMITGYMDSRNTKYLKKTDRILDEILKLAPQSKKREEYERDAKGAKDYIRHDLPVTFPPK